ncbi:MAG TPA: FAD-binding oxidoreductase [Thermomicrobiaceae bacterium]|nr:FAD-binding oxidoreductase [Thermomicrobiaceae bacterium]
MALRTNTRSPELSREAVQSLAQSLRGALIQPGDPTYDTARKVYNAMIDRHPALIAMCRDVADVIRGVNFAREHKLLLAIRGGGHNGPGLGVCDDGLVLDLSQMNGIRVDPVARTARVEAGAKLGDLDHATHGFGLATPSGIISTTGVGGITLGGGLGHLTRKLGLAIDNLLSADVVLADGRFVTADADHNADLFWAIRGGGGNFGVVTSFLFRLHPIDTVYAGPMLWPAERAAEILRWYRDFLPAAPDDLGGFFAFLRVPPGPPFPEDLHGKNMCGVVWCYTGPPARAEETFAPIRVRFGVPALDWVGPLPYPALQSMFDAVYPPGDQWYWKADFVKELSDEAIAEHVRHGSDLPTLQSTMHLYPIDGAASRVPEDATPWAYRDARWAEVIVGVSHDPQDRDLITRWARSYWEALHPYSAGGAYINFMMDEGQERVRTTYGPNYDRLAAIKATYDPANLFRVNQNITPP